MDQRMIARIVKPLQRRCDRYSLRFGIFDGHAPMFGAVFILHILQKGLLVLGSIRCLVLRINIHSLVPLSARSQHPVKIEDMCRNWKRARR